MKKMKKYKNILIGVIFFIVGFIVALALGYSATILFDSKDVKYDNTTGLSSTNVQDALDELYVKASKCSKSVFNLGDYFTLVPDASTYTIPYSLTHYTSDQTITPNELTLWRVIDIHCDGSVDAVSEYVSSTNIILSNNANITSGDTYGVLVYSNYIGILQTIAGQYAKAGYTIDTRMIGYGGQTAIIPYVNCINEDPVCISSTRRAFEGVFNNPPSTTTTPSPTTGIGQEYNGGVTGDTLYLRDYQLVSNIYKTDAATYGTTGLKAYNKAGQVKFYWLASRQFQYYNDNTFVFSLRSVTTDGSMTFWGVRAFNNGRWNDVMSSSSAVRPIITLKSGVTISSGSGTKNSPYTLN